MVDHQTCDHCQRPRRDLRTHLLPRTLRPAEPSDRISDLAVSLELCGACGEQRREDLREFLAGAAPTDLISPGGLDG